MKKLIFLLTILLVFTSCEKEKKETITTPEIKKEYISFGDKITSDNALSKEDMLTKFKSLKKGDTVQVKFASKINRVCKKKGCWVSLDLGSGEETFVRFKDYGFFMPLNSEDREVIVKGKAYVDILTVAELQHYAKDEGESQEEIDKIIEEEVTFAVKSTGVLMVK